MSDDWQETQLMSRDDIRTSVIASGAVLRQRYRLDSEIGRGGMGIVYRATDLELMREVAVKVLPRPSSSPDARHRPLRGTPAAARSHHPPISPLADLREPGGG